MLRLDLLMLELHVEPLSGLQWVEHRRTHRHGLLKVRRRQVAQLWVGCNQSLDCQGECVGLGEEAPLSQLTVADTGVCRRFVLAPPTPISAVMVVHA